MKSPIKNTLSTIIWNDVYLKHKMWYNFKSFIEYEHSMFKIKTTCSVKWMDGLGISVPNCYLLLAFGDGEKGDF